MTDIMTKNVRFRWGIVRLIDWFLIPFFVMIVLQVK